jgi:hypothetical protein
LTNRGPIEAALRLWPEHDATGFDYLDFLHAHGSPRLALFYSGLFWPGFVEFDEMVFLEATLEDDSARERVRAARSAHGGDRAKTEQLFNTVEVTSLFGARVGETTEDEDGLLASQLRAMWAACLQSMFPHRRFVVEVLPADDASDTAIRFYQPT